MRDGVTRAIALLLATVLALAARAEVGSRVGGGTLLSQACNGLGSGGLRQLLKLVHYSCGSCVAEL